MTFFPLCPVLPSSIYRNSVLQKQYKPLTSFIGNTSTIVWQYQTGGQVRSKPAIGDVDGDGQMEVVVGSEDNSIYCLSGINGSVKWSYKTGGLIESSPAIGDVDGDGRKEVIISSSDDKVYCLWGINGSVKWFYKTGGPVYSSPAIGDVDGDGRKEVIIGSSDHNIYCLWGINGSVKWDYTTVTHVSGSPIISDLDNDGQQEVIIGPDTNILYCLYGKNGSVKWSYVSSYGAIPFAIGDLLGDGRKEIVCGATHTIVCLYGTNGSVRWSVGYSNYYDSIAIGDLNGDGHNEVAVGSYDGKAYCLYGYNGSIKWTDNLNPTNPAYAILIGDVDGDGHQEVLVGFNKLYCLCGKDGNVKWALSGHGEDSPTIGDVDNDNKVELILGSPDSNVYCLIGNGNGITHSANSSYEYCTIGHLVSWTIYDSSTTTTGYTIYRNGTMIATNSWIPGKPVTIGVDGLAIGSYNYTIVATDGLGDSVQDTVIVTVYNAAPTITHPADMSCEYTTTGHSISWTIIDNSVATTLHTIYRNGTPIASNTWASGTPVTIGVDGLSMGSYNYTIVASDGLGGSVQDTVIVTVYNAAPTITHPADMSCDYNTTGHLISWTITDASTSTRSYTIYRNGIPNATGSWISGMPVTLIIDGLSVGLYNYTIKAIDGFGGSVQDTVFVTILTTKPSAPMNLQLISGDGQVVLSWQPPANNGGSAITGYKIYRGTSASSEILYATVDGDTTTYTDENVTNGQTYYYTITAISAVGESSKVTEVQASPSMAVYKIVLIIAACVVAGIAIIKITPKVIKKYKVKRQERTERLRKIEEERQQQAEAERQQQLELKRQQQAEADRQRKIELKRQQQAEAESQQQLELKRQQQAEATRQRKLELERKQQAEKERQRQLCNVCIRQGQELASANDWEGAINAFSQALGIARASTLENEETLANEAMKSAKKSWAADLDARLKDALSLIEQGDYETALESLGTIKDDATRGDFKTKVARVEERIATTSMFKQLARMIRVAKRLKIDDVCEVLKRPRSELFDRFIEWSEKFGFMIDGDYLVIGENANLEGVMADLDKAFAEWNAKEKSKQGKLE